MSIAFINEIKWETVFGCILASIASGCVGYYWTHLSDNDSERKRFWGKSGLITIISSTGPFVLRYWGIKEIQIVYGIFWILGTIIGIYRGRKSLVESYCRGLEDIPKNDREYLSAWIYRTLFSQGSSKTEAELNKKIKSFRKNCDKSVSGVIVQLHDFIHAARNDAVQYYEKFDLIILENAKSGKIGFDQIGKQLEEEFKQYLGNCLNKMVDIFEVLTGKTRKLWVAARIHKRINGVGYYETILRTKYDNRQKSSKPIPEDSGFPKHLKDEYKKNKGVIILGPQKKSDIWVETENDKLKNDQNILAAPIIMKPMTSAISNSMHEEMCMIIYINSPDANTFNNSHKDYLKCCSDVFSLYFSLAIRRYPGII